MTAVWICLAGAAGTGARYLLTLWAVDRLGSAFPYGTLLVNLVGCFLISAVMQMAATLEWTAATRLTITTGFLGGFTTYSAFNHETMRLMQQGSGALAVANVAITMVGGLLSGWAGMLVGRLLVGR